DGTGIYNPKVVRDALRPLRRAARAGEFAPVCTLHPSKGRAGSFTDLVSGSVQFGAVARAALILLRDPHDAAGERRILVRGKAKAPRVTSYTFQIVSTGVEIDGHHFEVPVLAEWQDDTRTLTDLLDEQHRPVQARREADAEERAWKLMEQATEDWQD